MSARSRADRANRMRPLRYAAGLLRRGAGTLGRLIGEATAAGTTDARPPIRPHPASGTRRILLHRGPSAPIVGVLVLIVLIAGMLGFERITGIPVLPSALTAGLRPPPKKFPVLDPSTPVAITIAHIDLSAPVHQVGMAADGTIGVPDASRSREAGWYDQSPTPGQYGPAVIVGHVDDGSGPAVFHDLKNLRPGDRVEIRRMDRSVAIFEVNSVKRFDKEQFPTQEVFGDFSRPNLRLITCGGAWVGGETGYADNVVVFASLVRARHG